MHARKRKPRIDILALSFLLVWTFCVNLHRDIEKDYICHNN